MQRRFGVHGNALEWLCDFLRDRAQVVGAGGQESDVVALKYGVPQGSVLGPKRFIEYAEDVTRLLETHELQYHLFADDMQALQHGPPADVPRIVSALDNCFADISDWCASKRLQLNATKTEVLWFGSAANLRKIPPGSGSVHAGSSVIEPLSVVRDLGVMIDAQLSMQEHVSRTARSCFFHLRRLRSVRAQLGRDVTDANLVAALVLSRLDYCNAVLAELPASTLAPLQRVLHAAARLVCGLRPRDHVTASLKELHWLPIRQRIDYKLCLMVHNVSVGHAPAYLSDILKPVAAVPSRAHLRDAAEGDFVVPGSRLKLGDRAFSIAAPRAWNRLPTELKLTLSTPAFKRGLKTFLFRTAYAD